VVIEFFCEMDQMHDEELGFFEPRPWHQDRPQRPKVWGDDTPANWWGPMSHSPNRSEGAATKPAGEPAPESTAPARASSLARQRIPATKKTAKQKDTRPRQSRR
jgi:hypothetical protein